MTIPRLALVFPGQGAQRSGMGMPWTRSPGWSVVAEVSEVAGRDVAALLLDADAATLRRTDNAQLAVLALTLVALTELRHQHPLTTFPGGCAGHGLGEYSALVAAGILDPQDAVRLITVRGAAMRAAGERAEGAMATVTGLDGTRVQQVVDDEHARGGRVWVAHFDAPRQTTVAGQAADLERCARSLERAGAVKVTPLAVGGAFHTPLMAEAAEPVAAALAAARFMPGHTAVVSGSDSRTYRGGPHWAELLGRQLTAPVRWSDTLRTLTNELACDRLLEIGPGRALTGLAESVVPRIPRTAFSDPGRPLVPAGS
ncbi:MULTISPECIES: ACP S-malonyltransferase [Streptomyces]|uniref:Malonyl CoA-acyl carrier protein transacylase n=1 Tax=Streptomyces chilikensis TaxID=1194079 RepID=A0ABV3EKE8_9ACTN|nr:MULTISPECIES: ACP S-malonyltransferase [Streptomyces]MDH6225204.1 [acyl-carrier-protein] S-malonyltransferase [Streptomyces sp. MJP52]